MRNYVNENASDTEEEEEEVIGWCWWERESENDRRSAFRPSLVQIHLKYRVVKSTSRNLATESNGCCVSATGDDRIWCWCWSPRWSEQNDFLQRQVYFYAKVGEYRFSRIEKSQSHSQQVGSGTADLEMNSWEIVDLIRLCWDGIGREDENEQWPSSLSEWRGSWEKNYSREQNILIFTW